MMGVHRHSATEVGSRDIVRRSRSGFPRAKPSGSAFVLHAGLHHWQLDAGEPAPGLLDRHQPAKPLARRHLRGPRRLDPLSACHGPKHLQRALGGAEQGHADCPETPPLGIGQGHAGLLLERPPTPRGARIRNSDRAKSIGCERQDLTVISKRRDGGIQSVAIPARWDVDRRRPLSELFPAVGDDQRLKGIPHRYDIGHC